MGVYLLVFGFMTLCYIVYKIVLFKQQNNVEDDSYYNYEIAISAMRKNELLRIIEDEATSSSRRQEALDRFNKYFSKIRGS